MDLKALKHAIKSGYHITLNEAQALIAEVESLKAENEMLNTKVEMEQRTISRFERRTTERWDENDNLRKALSMAKIPHLIVDEDCFYSCPKSGGCCNDNIDDSYCDCGADKHNKAIDNVLKTAS